jgi:hypothetical protein
MGFSGMAMLTIATYGSEYMPKVVGKLDIHVKLLEFKMLIMLNKNSNIFTS